MTLWMRLDWRVARASLAALLVLAVGSAAFWGYLRLHLPDEPAMAASPEGAPVPIDSFTAEELAVYRAVLVSLRQKGERVNLVADKVGWAEGLGESGCSANHTDRIEPSRYSHIFGNKALVGIGLPDISVVREDEVETILQETVQTQKFPKRDAKLNPNEEAAYRGYFEFSEVRFDRFHDHAVLDFEFVCPGLCGRGEQVWLVKKHGEWTVEERCLTWRS